MRFRHAALAAALLSVACSRPVENNVADKYRNYRDVHSYANPQDIRVRHVDLDLNVSFEKKTLSGTAMLTVDRISRDFDAPLVLDTRDLTIRSAEASVDGVNFQPAKFDLGQPDKILGTPLTIQLPARVTQVRVTYETSPGATGLQWVTPAQTAGKKHPFLYSQSEAIHARSWIPLQDSPGVRVTYSARVRTPKELLGLMSARNDPDPPTRGDYRFDMRKPIPSYLIAIGVGDLAYKPVSMRAGVYAEPSVLPAAAKEFDDTEKMIRAAEALYGLYRWEQYDLLVLPPSFPYGGMENPRLTFATPTVIVGDKSLVGLVSHELAHSWSGNLVTNATWRDFWLNEGFTTYFENRIQEAVYGKERAEMEALLARRELERDMKQIAPKDQVLYVDLNGRDPDEGGTNVPYTKGMLLLRRIEEVFGRQRFDGFLQGYFTNFAFRSITTGDFVEYIQKNLFEHDRSLASQINLEEWLSAPGLPADAPMPKSPTLERVQQYAESWSKGRIALGSIPVKDWSTLEWVQFLTCLPTADVRRLGELDAAFHLTASRNPEIEFQWLMMCLRAQYTPAYARAERFLIEIGRRKYIKPLYEEMVKSPEGRKRAAAVFAKAETGYHPISAMTIREVLKSAQGPEMDKK